MNGILLLIIILATSLSAQYASGPEAAGGGIDKLSRKNGQLSKFNEWEFSMILGGNISGSSSADLYNLSVGKQFGALYLSAEYTPGFSKEFILRKNSSIIIDDSTNLSTPLNTELTYKENFSLGFNYHITPSLNMAVNFSRIEQIFTDESAEPFFSVDTISFITKTRTTYNTGIWKSDLAISWQVNDFLNIGFYTNNLLFTREDPAVLENGIYDFNDKKSIHPRIIYFSETHGASLTVGTDESYSLQGNYRLSLANGALNLFAGFGKISGVPGFVNYINPALSYSRDFYRITVSLYKFFNNSPEVSGYSDFTENKINSTLFNRYESDKIFLTANVALSFKSEIKAKFVGIRSQEEIYPTLGEKYSRFPFATALVTNISDVIINVKPASFIPELNSIPVYSAVIAISPSDTVEVPFFTIVEETGRKFEKRFISQAEFSITTDNSEPDDVLQRPVIVGGRNEWDGQIVSLSHFVYSDFEKVRKLAQEKLAAQNIQSGLTQKFEIIKHLFTSFMTEMRYVSDPRASREYVQFPLETLELKGGDCDDLSVVFSSVLESVGIQTAFVDYRDSVLNHVNLLVNTEIPAGYGSLITNNDKKYYVRKNIRGEGEIWISVEATLFESFEKAWEIGSEKFYNEAVSKSGLLNSKVNIIDVR